MKLVLAENKKDIFKVINIRKDVFILEQHVSIEEELDKFDVIADHYLVLDDNNYVATGRVYYHNNTAFIGRIAVLKPYRKKGYARFLMSELLMITKEKNISKIKIGAQKQALGFYEKLGFVVSGDMYYDANIEHYPMEMIL